MNTARATFALLPGLLLFAATAYAQGSTQRWVFQHDAQQGSFSIARSDPLSTTTPFTLFPSATQSSLVIRDGRLGINTLTPRAALEIYAPGNQPFVASPALLVNQTDFSADVVVFQRDGEDIASVDNTGRGIFNGGTQTGGTDLAEAFSVEGDLSTYEPGDVLVISIRTDRTVEKSTTPCSRLVAGVYATKPGVLLTEYSLDDDLSEMLPMGIAGVIPTKVSSENGPIRRGDLLVTSRTPGHAMRADPEVLSVGMVLGKALEDFSEEGTGLITVLVNVK